GACLGGEGAYRPDLYYMRGPGPKWHAKYGSLAARANATGGASGRSDRAPAHRAQSWFRQPSLRIGATPLPVTKPDQATSQAFDCRLRASSNGGAVHRSYPLVFDEPL